MYMLLEFVLNECRSNAVHMKNITVFYILVLTVYAYTVYIGGNHCFTDQYLAGEVWLSSSIASTTRPAFIPASKQRAVPSTHRVTDTGLTLGQCLITLDQRRASVSILAGLISSTATQ